MSEVREAEARAPEREPSGDGRALRWVFGIAPLVLLGIAVLAFFAVDPLADLREGVPPIEELTVERAVLDERPREIVLEVTNGGPDPVTIAQVLVDEAYWTHEILPDAELGRLDSARVHVPYPWVEGEAHVVKLITATGVTFEHEIGVATASPEVSGSTLGSFTLIGVFVGVIPVLVGLLWLPFVRRVSTAWVNFFLALTAGLLVFLAVDATDEAFEVAEAVPGAFQGVGLIAVGVLGAIAALYGVDGWIRRRRGGDVTPLFVAALIAVGIGLHNLGEGLAIGAAHALGEIGLTTFLIVGFMLHNVTEGLGIVAPLARSRVSLWWVVVLGLVAGVPAIVGTWVGGLAYDPALTVLFLSLGVGAIVQVVWEIGRMMTREARSLAAPMNAAGFMAGVAVMYLTGLLIAA